jgi:putative redox protein
MAGATTYQPIVVTPAGKLRFEAQVRSHTIVVDQPEYGGGDDSAPMPTELLGVSFGTCIALYVKRFLETRNLPHEGLRVEVTQKGTTNPARIGEFQARVIIPHELPERYAAMLEQVATSCPVHNTLELGASLDVSIEMPVTAG